VLADAIERMRTGRFIRDAGYDGEYGVIRVFQPGELANRGLKLPLFGEVESSAPSDESAHPNAVSRKAKVVIPIPASSTIAQSPVIRSIT
jgi:hypothetical protein